MLEGPSSGRVARSPRDRSGPLTGLLSTENLDSLRKACVTGLVGLPTTAGVVLVGLPSPHEIVLRGPPHVSAGLPQPLGRQPTNDAGICGGGDAATTPALLFSVADSPH